MHIKFDVYKVILILNISVLIYCAPQTSYVCEVTCPPNTVCVGDNKCSCIDRLLPGSKIDDNNRDPYFPKLPFCVEETTLADYDFEIIDYDIELTTSTTSISDNIFLLDDDMFYTILGILSICLALIVLIMFIKRN